MASPTERKGLYRRTPRRLNEFHRAFRHRNGTGKIPAASAEKSPAIINYKGNNIT
jgi:hypothetical protein